VEPSKRVRIARLVREDVETRGSAPEVVIEIGGARVAVHSGFDPATLRAVVEVLGDLRSAESR
jgi:hypothetical protein